MSGESISLQLITNQDAKPALYAFISGNEVLYVGKTNQRLKKRLYSYSKPGLTQLTNIRISAKIRETLAENVLLEVYAFSQIEQKSLGPFTINLPAALEDDIIRKVKPVWNKRL